MAVRKPEVVVLSDVHLGTYGCNAQELNDYLLSIEPGMLVLNGDIIDMWQFSKNYFPAAHMETLQIILGYLRKGIPVYYITGNHDELLRKFSDFKMDNLHIVDKLVLNLDGKKAWIFHGDVFDLSVHHAKWIAILGGKSYDLLILINRWINRMLVKVGRERVSLSKKIKNSVKKAVQFVQDFEKVAAQHAIDHQYDYVICGHIHQPQMKRYFNSKGSVMYLNSGDWVENLTSLEYEQGTWTLYHHLETVPIEIESLMLPEMHVYNSFHLESLVLEN